MAAPVFRNILKKTNLNCAINAQRLIVRLIPLKQKRAQSSPQRN